MKRLSCYIVLLILLTVSSPLYGGMYSWTDENGVKHFSDTAPSQDTEDVNVIETPENSKPSDDYNEQKSDSSSVNLEALKELRSMLVFCSKLEKKLTFEELLSVEPLLIQITKPRIIKELTQEEKAQVEILSSKSEKAKEGLTQQQLAKLNLVVTYFNARWEQEYGEELSPAELEDLDMLLRSKWNKMRENLKNNNIDGALQYFYPEVVPRYKKMFLFIDEKVPGGISAEAEKLPDPILIKIEKNKVTYILVRKENGDYLEYPLYFIKDIFYTGQWKIYDY